MNLPNDLKYTATHEWAKAEADGTVSCGITHFGQEQLGDMVYVGAPEIGRQVQTGDACGVVESVKAASDLYAPLSGEVTAVNDELANAPEAVNQDAYAAWIFRIRPIAAPADLSALLDATDYRKLVDSAA
ncbi:MAG: glycine cleavage system protein GcvH [Sulfuricella sp.]|nr:glycine cleavage system protein GcvH [Sulfuricella sp.]